MPTGLFVTHPLTGEKIEVWVGNYVLMSYGEGAVMGVPAHDERDFRFRQEVRTADQAGHRRGGQAVQPRRLARVVRRQGKRRLRELRQIRRPALHRSGRRHRRRPQGQRPRRQAGAVAPARLGHLAPALLGLPIPLIHCDGCGAVPVPDEQLPVVLPEDCVPDGTGNPLNKRADFLNCTCPKCGKPARRETDTMDTFVDSSWYYMRFACPDQAERDGRRARQLLAAGRPVHRRHRARHPAPAVLALLDQGDARPGPGQARRAVRQPADPGHGAERNLLPQAPTAGRIAYFNPAEVEIEATMPAASAPAPRSRPTASRSNPAASAPCRSRRTTASIRRR